jgi:hypothetical protein
MYIQESVQHNLFYYVFKKATCFDFHKAILRLSIDFLTSSVLQCSRKIGCVGLILVGTLLVSFIFLPQRDG